MTMVLTKNKLTTIHLGKGQVYEDNREEFITIQYDTTYTLNEVLELYKDDFDYYAIDTGFDSPFGLDAFYISNTLYKGHNVPLMK